MSISPWDELQELAADKYVALELDGSEWRLAEGDGYPLSSNRNRFEFLMWAQIRAIIEQVATLTAERDALLEDIKERDRTYLAVQRAEGLEREKVEAERDALSMALHRSYPSVQKAEGLERDKLEAEMNRQNAALEEIAARLEVHQHAMCSECEGIRRFVASVLDSEYWEAAMNQAGEALGGIRTPIPPSVFSSEQARKEIEKRHIEPLTPETHSHGKAEPEFGGDV